MLFFALLVLSQNPSPPPDATATRRGLVNTGTQTFGGIKTFVDGGIIADLRPGSTFNGQALSVPGDATLADAGLVNISAQTFAGLKTFDGGIAADLRDGSAIRGFQFCTVPPVPGQVLTYNGASWCPEYREPAYFEEAPRSSVAMTSACACTSPTVTATGQALTITRASAATCTKGPTTSGIANGDLVSCGSGQALVMPGLDGTGPVGLTVEGALTNPVLFPNTLNNVNWGITANIASPVVVSTTNTDPFGGTTCSRVQFPATAGAQYSMLRQSGSGSAPQSAGCYARTVDGGVGDLCVFAGDGPFAQRYAVSGTSWTRVRAENSSRPSIALFIGVDSSDCATGNFAAQDVYLCGCQLEASAASLTSFVSGSRVATVPSASVSVSGSTFSTMVTWRAPPFFLAGATAFQLFKDASNSVTAYSTSTGALSCDVRIAGTTVTTTSLTVMTPSVSNRVGCYYDGLSTAACVNGVCTLTAGTVTMFAGASTFYLGTRSTTGNEANSTLRDWCYDPAPNRCRRTTDGPRAFAGFGDSITAAPSGVGTGWPDRYSVLFSPAVMTNWGLNGATANDIYVTRWLISGVSRYSDVVVLGGINDIRTTSNDAITIFNTLKLTYTMALAEGARLYLVTVMPFSNFSGWTTAKQQVLTDLNTLIRNYCATTPNCTLIDAYNSTLRVGTALNPAYDSGDGLHPSQAGSDVLATLIRSYVY